MATTNSKLSINSADLTSSKLALSIAVDLKKATGDNLDSTSGVQRASIPASTTNLSLLAATSSYVARSTGTTYGTNLHKNYVYIKNCTATTGQGTVMIYTDANTDLNAAGGTAACEDNTCDHPIAVLAKDDFAIIPSPMYSGLKITNIDASNAALVEVLILG